MKKIKYFSFCIFVIFIFCLQDAQAVIALKAIYNLSDSCSEIRMRSGQTYKVKILDIDALKVRYSNCAQADNKVNSLDLSAIYSILMPDGAVVYQYKKPNVSGIDDKKQRLKSDTLQIGNEPKQTTNELVNKPRKLNIPALLGGILGLTFILGLLFKNELIFKDLPILSGITGLSALVLSIIGWVQCNLAPEKYKGKTLAKLGVYAMSAAILFFLFLFIYIFTY